MSDPGLSRWQKWSLATLAAAWIGAVAGSAGSLPSLVLTTLLIGGVAAFVAFAPLLSRFKRFLLAPAAPLNLAVLRIVVFAVLLVLLATEPIRQVAAWPREDFVWPAVAGPLLARLPIGVEIVDALLPVAITATVLAIAGCLTRMAAWTSVVLAIYLLGICQCAGEVDHMMHLVVLIALLIACSPAGDAVAIDAVAKAVWLADRGQIRRTGRRVRYGMPIRFAMLVLALSYFFPGFWSLAEMAEGWFAATAPPYAESTRHSDSASTSLAVLACSVVGLAWPLTLLWWPSRVLWAGLGLLLHSMAGSLAYVGSYTTQAMYVMFIDWQRIFTWIGRKLFGEKLVVLYDGNCKLCRRTMALFVTLDWLDSLKPVSAFDRRRFTDLGLGHLEDAALMTDMHAAERGAKAAWRVTRGFEAYQRIAWRVPLLWPTLPLVYLPPVVAIGNRVYRRVADTRACTVPIAAKSPASSPAHWSVVPLVVVAVAILAAQVFVGIGRLHDSWPVACYPLFGPAAAASFPSRSPAGEAADLLAASQPEVVVGYIASIASGNSVRPGVAETGNSLNSGQASVRPEFDPAVTPDMGEA